LSIKLNRGVTTCEARKQVHCEAIVEDDPVDRMPVAGRATIIGGRLAGQVIADLRKAVELAERNLALHP